MKKSSEPKELPKYGNWMPKKFILIGLLLSAGSTAFAIVVPILWIEILLGILAIFCGIIVFNAIYAYYMFSPRGGNLQNKIQDTVVDLLSWDGHGTCLEVGCGSAPVTIKLAKKFPSGNIVGSDFWGETYFEFSEKQCVKNAQMECVGDRVKFQFADAGKLPFEDESFDAVVSNLTFHEVNTFKRSERYKSILEAFRVLKKGGAFAFQDVFNMKMTFGDFRKLEEILAKHVSEIKWLDSFAHLKIPGLLNNVIMLQGLGIFYGKK